ncbi:hypothetical protein H4R34_005647 [Dimargaris verticillata]|uniref:Importin-7/11-like TPR repeats domain-containing protein n=1 Tax=Dimargaris verticillata TaxID=2761393 RepID=A0A9W8AWL9_9FUNG|nr:hypothetical protein H4R34_005647 [Dimargaris verticillata]
MSDQFIAQFAELLVNHYLRLTTRDLDEWHTDPETWLINEAADHWELSLRPCAEKMYIQLTNKYRHCLLPLIYRALRASIHDQTTPDKVLATDAFYTSIGICAHELFDAINYNEWIVNKLIPETALQGDFGTVLRRRVLWLLDALVDVSLNRETRRQVYQLLQDMVQPSQHLVVRMTTVATLHTWVDSLEFYPSDFSPHVEAILTGLTHLLQSLSETECRMKVVNLLSLISDRMEHRVAPYANALIGVIGSVWTDATEEHLLCSAILVALAKLVRSLGPMSVDYHELLARLIHYSAQSDAYGFGYLLEDGLTLWVALLRHTPSMSPSLLALLPDLFRQTDRELVVCQDMLRLVRHYLVLDAPLVLKTTGADTYQFIGRLITECDTEIATHIGRALEVIPQCAPVDLYGPALVASGLFHHTMNTICSNEAMAYMNVALVGFLARIIIQDTAFFLQAVDHSQQEVEGVDVLDQLLATWLDVHDCMMHPKHRKLSTLALTLIVGTGRPAALRNFPAVVGIWTGFLNEFQENDQGDVPAYWKPDEFDQEEEDEDTTETCNPSTGRLSKVTYESQQQLLFNDMSKKLINGGPFLMI